MNSTIHRALAGALIAACSFCIAAASHAQAPKVIKISHQFPAATGDTAISATSWRGSSPPRSISAPTASSRSRSIRTGRWSRRQPVRRVRKGTLDMTVLPLAYGGGEVPEVNLTLMPAMITSYEQGLPLEDRADRQGAGEDPR